MKLIEFLFILQGPTVVLRRGNRQLIMPFTEK